jgi:hypothetical protein
MVLAALAPAAVLALGVVAAREARALPALPGAVDGLALDTPKLWGVTRGGIAAASASYGAAGLPAIGAEVALRLAPTPQARLVDRWQPQALVPPARFLDVARIEAGSISLFMSGGVGGRTLWAVCHRVGRVCHPDAGSQRRAMLASLARDPLARGALIVLSLPVPPGAVLGLQSDLHQYLLTAMDQIAARTMR